jgi:hypothetical protein
VTVSWDQRCIAYSMLLSGSSAQETARRFRVNTGAVVEWARLAGMVIRMGARGGIEPVDDSESVTRRPRAYRRLTREDRIFIEMAVSSTPTWSVRAIAKHLGVAASTVSRELRRHPIETGRGRGATREFKYHAGIAHHHSMRLRRACRSGKLEQPGLRALVVAGLNEKHSPQQVAGRLRMQFPDRPELHVSHETIYQALYVQGRGALRHELTECSRRAAQRRLRDPQAVIAGLPPDRRPLPTVTQYDDLLQRRTAPADPTTTGKEGTTNT